MQELLKDFVNSEKYRKHSPRKGREAIIPAVEGAEVGDAVTRSGYTALITEVTPTTLTVVDLYFWWED